MENGEATIKVPTTGVFDFPKLIQEGKGKYVDKTAFLYELCNGADQQFFLSRPRRFGKSLMLSTLKAMFEGRRELFKGLAIYSLPWEGWAQPTPVYSLTMSSAVGETYELFMVQLAKLVKRLCAEAGIGLRLHRVLRRGQLPPGVHLPGAGALHQFCEMNRSFMI